MALPMLVNGGDCGPVNPLLSLGKRFDQDRGVSQDQFVAGRAGPSRQAFRTPTTAAPGFEQDAARFFSSQPTLQTHAAPAPAFNLSSFRGALPSLQTAAVPAPAAPSAWAADFLALAPAPSTVAATQRTAASSFSNASAFAPQSSYTSPGQNFQPTLGLNAMHMPTFEARDALVPGRTIPSQLSDAQLAAEFRAVESLQANCAGTQPFMAANTVPLAEASAEAAGRTLPNDELARTAAQVLASVAHDSSAKFASSSFMGLMRQLRDGDVALDGDKLVPREEAQAGGWGAEFAADLKGKGKQRADGPTHMGGSGSASGTAAAFNFGGAIPAQAASSTARISPTARAQELPAEHDANDAYFAQENADYMRFWADADTQRFGPAQAPASSVTSQDADWGHLQGDWDRFEATASGIRAVEPYPFAPHNPYLGTMMRQHALHGGAPALEDSVLALEAAVRAAPGSPAAWTALGVRQQEAERERRALTALRRALALDPAHQPARLALAIGLTNEGARADAAAELAEWAERRAGTGAGALAAREGEGRAEHARRLIDALLDVARAEADVDADVQIALAVLLQLNEEWDKSNDCFRAALAARPEDWLLWNRVGATLANSGQPEQALEYYAQALSLNPLYIRARYNMGIALVNLRRYPEAAERFFDALVMQESDATVSRTPPIGAADGLGPVLGPQLDVAEEAQGLTSGALWDSLRSASQRMGRADLATLCEKRDLEGFRTALDVAVV